MKKLLLLLLAFVVAVPAFAAKLDPETTVLITKAEKDAYQNLKSNSEKDQFIKDFWAKRDPTPGTPDNEYRDEIRKRVKDVANALRREDSWEMDMGQTLILLGPPTKAQNATEKTNEAEATWYPESDEGGGREPETSGPSASGERKKIFTYNSLPEGVATGELKLEFLEVRNKWKFRDSKKGEPILERARENELKRMTQIAQNTASPGSGKPVPAAQVTPSPAVPQPVVISPEIKSALDTTSSGTAPNAVPFGSVASSFQTSTGEIFATLAVNTPAPVPGAKVGVRVLDSSGTIVQETELPFESGTEAAGYFQTKVLLPAPGDYTVLTAVGNGPQAGGAKHTLTVPDPAKFNASSIILAKKFTALPEAKPEKEPYTFGKIKVHPNVEGTFAKTDELIIVYEVYNPQIDAASGKPNLEVVYNFERDGKAKKTAPAAPSGLVTGKKMTISISYPLQTFAAGNYRLIAEITDKANGEKITRASSFKIQ